MIINLDEIDSTNEYLKRMSNDGYNSDEMLVVTAQYQTAGKGRRGRSWVTEPGTALMFSVLLKPRLKLDDCSMLTLVMALAVKRSLSDMDIEAMIKWPNDIVIGTKKVCGILTEYSGGRVICGIGINVNTRAFPEELSHIATSLYLETGRETDRAALAASVMNHFEPLYDRFLSGGFAALADEYKKLCVTIGRKVTVTGAGDTIRGTAAGITPDGGLVLDTENGQKIITSGEASVRGIYGYI